MQVRNTINIINLIFFYYHRLFFTLTHSTVFCSNTSTMASIQPRLHTQETAISLSRNARRRLLLIFILLEVGPSTNPSDSFIDSHLLMRSGPAHVASFYRIELIPLSLEWSLRFDLVVILGIWLRVGREWSARMRWWFWDHRIENRIGFCWKNGRYKP